MAGGIRYINFDGLVKVFFPLDSNGLHGFKSESLWTKKIENENYLVMNVPFYLKSISLYDIINIEKTSGDLNFKTIVSRGGHSTYRIIIDKKICESIFEKYLKPLEELGCTYEKAKNNFYAIDVPPYSNIHKVYQLLEDGEHNSIWEFEEGHCGHVIKNA